MSLKGEDALILAMDYTEQTLKGQGALKGEDGFSPVITENTNTGDVYKLDITTKDGKITTPNLVGKQGIQGEIGPQGKPADNPIVTENADNTDEIYKLDLTVGETVFTTRNIQGKQGLEGVSPSVTTNPDNTAEDYRLNITTKGGTFTTPNLRGPQGEIGPQGESAASAINPRGDYDVNADPHYTISDYITSAEGNTYVCKKDNPGNVAPTDGTVNDEFWQVLALRGAKGEAGKDGEKGADGVIFTPSIDENGILSFTNNGGLENPNPIDIKGDNGVTFTPSIDAEGYLSFTNNGNLENPEPIKVLGQDGADGKDGIDGTTYIPSIGTVTTVESNVDASAGVTVDEETKEAVFNFAIPKGNKGLDGVQISDNETVEDKTWSSKKTSSKIAEVDASLGELEGKVNNLSHIKFATTRTKTNIDEILNIGTIGVYYQLYDYNSTGTKPTNADKSGIVKTEVWDNGGKYAVQEYDEINTGNRKYMRYFNIGTWSDWTELATMDKVNASLGELCNKKIYCGEVTGTTVNGVISTINPIGKVGNIIVTIKYANGNPYGYSVTAQATLSELNFYFRWHRESDGAEAYPPNGIEITISYMIFY